VVKQRQRANVESLARRPDSLETGAKGGQKQMVLFTSGTTGVPRWWCTRWDCPERGIPHGVGAGTVWGTFTKNIRLMAG